MPPRETLIIKLGALGDVLRTTPLLRRLPGRVTWVTDEAALPLLAGHPRLRLVGLRQAAGALSKRFDLLVNFDEDPRACRLAARADAALKVGARLEGGTAAYCERSAPWFDMSLISRLGRRRADALKARGRRAYQDYLFAACGLRFAGEEYWLPLRPRRAPAGRVALEARAGERWPAKRWPGFEPLKGWLRSHGREPVVLRQRGELARYIEDINGCGIVVAADTLAMHVGLALRKRVVAIFNCTSPHEIHGYGRLVKVVNPRLRDFFYSRKPLPAGAALPLAAVARAVDVAAAGGDLLS